MSQHEIGRETAAQLLYSEDRCGSHWLLFLISIIVTAAAILGFLLLVVMAVLLPPMWGFVLFAVPLLMWVFRLARTASGGRRAGIRIDTDCIQIGGIRARDRRIRHHRWPPRKSFRAGRQSRAVFICQWEGARSLYLLTDRTEIKHLLGDWKRFRKQTRGLRSPLGVIYAPFSKSVLAITHNAIDAKSDPVEFRPSRGPYGNIEPVKSPTWLVPTRNPEALRAALEQAPGAPHVQDELPPEAIFQFRSG